MHLKKEEKQILWKKYRALNLSEEEAQIRLNNFINYLNNLVIKLKAENKSKGEIEEKFKQEFWKMCQKLEK